MLCTAFSQLTIAIKGAGEMASAVAWRLYQAGLRRIFMLEVPAPRAVRRRVAFCEAVHEGQQTVEGVTAVLTDARAVAAAWQAGHIAVLVDPRWRSLAPLAPDVLVDAILAKRNLGTHLQDAPLVIGLGPGFTAGLDTHAVIETQRGHDLGRILTSGGAAPNTGRPGRIGGYDEERVLRAPADGTFEARLPIGQMVRCDETVGEVDGRPVPARIDGVLRGLLRSGTAVEKGLKLGDIDPRGQIAYCNTISDKARAISGSVLEAVLRLYPQRLAIPAGSAAAVADTDLAEAVRAGDPRAAAQAISAVEGAAPGALALLDTLYAHTGRARRIGITGPPGAGKSAMAAQLIRRLRADRLTVGVVAVDPTSPFTGGAFLGDRLRLRAVADDPGVFIRSMATRGSLGGLTRQALAAGDILDAAGRDVVIFETVGVGQTEHDVMTAVDSVVVLTVPEAGDLIQTLKAGVMEIGDIFVVNKCDLPGADRMQADLAAALHMRAALPSWEPPVRPANARSGEGVDTLYADLQAHWRHLASHDLLHARRRQRAEACIRLWVDEQVRHAFWTPVRRALLEGGLAPPGRGPSPYAIVQTLTGSS